MYYYSEEFIFQMKLWVDWIVTNLLQVHWIATLDSSLKSFCKNLQNCKKLTKLEQQQQQQQLFRRSQNTKTKHFIQNPSINLSFSIFSANSKFEGFRGWFGHWDRNQLLKISSFIFTHLPLGRIALLNHKLKSNSWKISIWFSKEIPFLLGPN